MSSLKQFYYCFKCRSTGNVIGFLQEFEGLSFVESVEALASKAGVEGFTRSFAKEVSYFKITVNCIAPGPIKTDLLRGITEEQIQKIIDHQAFKKIFNTIDVVNTVKTLLSMESENITGQVIHIGGV